MRKPFVFAVVAVATASCGFYEHVDAGDVLVCTDPVDGEIHTFTTPGMQQQNWGTCETYSVSFQYWFDDKAPDSAFDEYVGPPIPVRFNDGGKATLRGSVRVDLPKDDATLQDLHRTFRREDAIIAELIRPTVEKSAYMTGTLMSSAQSYADRRNDLLSFIEDQAAKGVYRTNAEDIEVEDTLSCRTDPKGARVCDKKTVKNVKLVLAADGTFARQEESPIVRFKTRLHSLSIREIEYEKVVADQITSQQSAFMAVQTAMANAKKAEQDRITVEQQGMASAAEAKWQQEKIKAQQVTEAQQKLEVAELARQTAEKDKARQILEGQGESEKRRLIMQADGALEKKLATYEKVQAAWADAFAKRAVPTTVFGGGTGGSGTDSDAGAFMTLMTARAARDLATDVTPTGK